uniref:Putative Phosphoribosyltransferase n=1 Tax=Magnetococcus massalia (strain MO-1) TaxID=451514 RepID=A0A1S7LLR3_MAGMO|nr:putative Phosphoribosyltransferase [Candidatus Magnetococcus massalia]
MALKQLVRGVLQSVVPSRCPLCSVAVADPMLPCRGCFDELPWLDSEQFCHRCGAEVSFSLPDGCGACRGDRQMQDQTLCAFAYQPPISTMAVGGKFADQTRWAALLGSWMEPLLADSLIQDDFSAVVPVPLHPKRLRQRGYNQSALIAGELARSLGVPLWVERLQRIRATTPQTRLNKLERTRNVHRAFTVEPALDGEHLLLVDDTMTTGSTVAEAARTLKRCGAGGVTVLVAAKALRKTSENR